MNEEARNVREAARESMAGDGMAESFGRECRRAVARAALKVMAFVAIVALACYATWMGVA